MSLVSFDKYAIKLLLFEIELFFNSLLNSRLELEVKT